MQFSNLLINKFIQLCQVPDMGFAAVFDISQSPSRKSLRLDCNDSALAATLFRASSLIRAAMKQLGIAVIEITVQGSLYWEISAQEYHFESLHNAMFKTVKNSKILTIKDVIEVSKSTYAKQNSLILEVMAEIYGSTISIYSTDRDRGYPLLCLFPGFGIEERMNRPIQELIGQPVLESVGLIGESKKKCIKTTINNRDEEQKQISLNLNNYNKVHYSFFDSRDGFTNWEKDLIGIPVSQEEVMIVTLDAEARQLQYWKEWLSFVKSKS